MDTRDELASLFCERSKAIAKKDDAATEAIDRVIAERLDQVDCFTMEDTLVLVEQRGMVERESPWFSLVTVVAWISRERAWESLESQGVPADEEFVDIEDGEFVNEHEQSKEEGPFDKNAVLRVLVGDAGETMEFPIRVGGTVQAALEGGGASQELVDLAAELPGGQLFLIEELLSEHSAIWRSID